MTEPAAPTLSIEPVISWPREAVPGKRYLLTVDLRTSQVGEDWPFEDEEVEFSCMLDAYPLFISSPLDDPILVIHRFGGTYRPVRYLLDAQSYTPDEAPEAVWLSLITKWGVPVRTMELPVRLVAEEPQPDYEALTVPVASPSPPPSVTELPDLPPAPEIPQPLPEPEPEPQAVRHPDDRPTFPQDPRQLLARRLRELRQNRWPDRKITQPELARALGDDKPLSVPLISSWESQTNPRIPALPRLESYAAVFATSRSFDGTEPRRLSPEEMTDEETLAMTDLRQELQALRSNALRAGAAYTDLGRIDQIEGLPSAGPWRFGDGYTITIVCNEWPEHVLSQIPNTNVDDPDYSEMLRYSDLDSLLELQGYLRAANPTNDLSLRAVDRLTADDYISHLVMLGGVDWNTPTNRALQQLPIRRIADWDTAGRQYFETSDEGATIQYQAILEDSDNRGILVEDVALFARTPNPFNRERTYTICTGMYARGTYGVVRALTDPRYHDRNAEYLRARFGESNSYFILTRVPIVNGVTLTPDWTDSNSILYEWSR
jgi:hypothetical protein